MTAMDASKLNHTPAPLPTPAHPQQDETPSPPLRSPDGMDSSYLPETEPAPSHPTVAETGVLSSSGPGPAHGQLQRRESSAGRRIIRLASFGGEGLVAKPPPGQLADESAVEI